MSEDSNNESMQFKTIIWNEKHTLILFIALIVYLIVGAALFRNAERDHEMAANQEIAAVNATYMYTQYRNTVIEWLLNSTSMTLEQATDLLDNATITTGSVNETNNWSYGGSLFFMLTLCTTIGYGTTAPVTFYGRLLVIILALIGIPITLAFLKYFGSMFKRLIGWLTIKNCCKENALSVTIELAIFIVIGLVFLIIIPTVILNKIENWSIFESLYYCLVTLTTVGFGDFVPGITTDDSLNDFYRCCVGVWIFIGLAYLFIIIELIQSLMEQMATKFGTMCCSKNKPTKV